MREVSCRPHAVARRPPRNDDRERADAEPRGAPGDLRAPRVRPRGELV